MMRSFRSSSAISCGLSITFLACYAALAAEENSSKGETQRESKVESLTKEAEIRPREAASGCWVHIWESGNFSDRDLVIWGPAAYPNMRGLPNAGGYDWGDQIDSLIVGPSCYVLAYEDENFGDTEIWFGPNQVVAELDELGFGDDIDSIKVFDHPPRGYFNWLTRQTEEGEPGLTSDGQLAVRRYTLELDDSGKLRDMDGAPIVTSARKEPERKGINARARQRSSELSVLADCTTRPTTLNRERKSCESPWEEITVPRGYVFAKDRLSVADHISYGSENAHYIEWDNYVEVIPGLEAPRTMRFRVTARSGRAPGERGRTQRTATCAYVELPN